MNPFQSLLYCRAWESGIAPLGFSEFTDIAGCPWHGERIVHLHWLAGVLRDTATGESARERIRVFAELLRELKDDSATLVWTMHNVLPHDSPLPDLECELREVVVREVDAIHLLRPGAHEAASPYYTIPESKCFVSPHPSYLGAYPDYVSREAARFELGLKPSDFVYLFFGSLRPYKGLPELLEAWDQLRRRVANGSRTPRLLIAGAPHGDHDAGDILRQCRGRDDVGVHLGKIPADEVQYYFRAADLCVLPFRRSLNSGTALLSLTFGLPLIAPASMEDAIPGTGVWFLPQDVSSLADAMVQAIESDLSSHRAAATALACELAPERASRLFFSALSAHLARS